MFRPNHILKQSKSEAMPKFVFFFDTETSNKQYDPKTKLLTFKFCYIALYRYDPIKNFYLVKELEAWTPAEVIDFISNNAQGNQRYWITAHNISFDARVINLFKGLTKQGWQRTKFIEENINFIATFRRDKTTLTIINNQQLFNTSLKNLGQSIGLEKKEVEFDSVSDKELVLYCRRDVDIMVKSWSSLTSFLTTNSLGQFKMTAASLSLSIFTHRFYHQPIYIHNNIKVIELERESYHGGRVEVFFKGNYNKGEVFNLDINSMYPFLMKTIKLPVKLLYYTERNPQRFLKINQNKFGFIINADIETNKPIIPIIRDSKLIFPTGRFNASFAEPEFNLLKEYGRLLKVNKIAVYKKDYIFSDFVDYFYNQRKEWERENKTAFAFFAKIILNSLYGKFGQKNTIYKKVGYDPNADDGIIETFDSRTGKWIKTKVIDGIIEESAGYEEGYNAFVSLSSYITSAARAYLYRLIARAGAYNVLYCDTDSIFVNREGYQNIVSYINNNELGRLKCVEHSQGIQISGLKDYVFHNKTVIKGIKKSAVKIAPNEYQQEQFENWRGSLRNGNLNIIRVKIITKKLSQSYTKGIVMPDHWVKPFALSEV